MRLIPASSTIRGDTSPPFTGSGDPDIVRSERLRRRIVSAAAIAVLGAAFSVLVGWQFGIGRLKTPLPGHSFMAPNAAAFLFLAALSLWLLRSGNPTGWRRRLARVFAFAMAVVSLHFLSEEIFQ